MVEIINVDHQQAVKSALDILKRGGVFVYPTDTLYGFGADATNAQAIEKINKIKRRSGPLSVMMADKETGCSLMNIDAKHYKLIESYLGGTQTLIVSVKHNIVCADILGEENTLGIRIPDNRFCNELSSIFGKPIISTSVNHSGETPMNDPIIIDAEFGSEIDLIIDAGTLPLSKGSTIYKFIDGKIIVLRK